MEYAAWFHLLLVCLSLGLSSDLGNAKSCRTLRQIAPSSEVSALSPFTIVKDPSSTSYLPSESENSASMEESKAYHMNRGVLVTIILLPLVVGLLMVSSVCYWFFQGKRTSACSKKQPVSKKKSDPLTSETYKVIPLVPFLNGLSCRPTRRKEYSHARIIEYSLIQEATDHFSNDSILGGGGFGCVYKARFDDDKFAAVKKLDEYNRQAGQEFENEVELMSKVQHPNLVSLLGFCIHGNARFLVYELMQNGSLEDQLHGPSHGSALPWFLRIKIALDSARGLEHLHEHCNPPVIHRDFKSSNILLDENFNAKLSDFGLAVKCPGFNGAPDVELLGTLGYVAPEYLLDGKLTEKSDVYAFGVVLLELLFGRKPVDKSLSTDRQSLVSWAMPKLTDRARLPSMIDPTIQDSINVKHLYQVAAIAVLCIQPEPSYRPLIADVVHSLVPLVPVELGGALRSTHAPSAGSGTGLP